MCLPFSKRRGAATLEFIFAFTFVVVLFLIIFSLEVFVIIRMAEAFDVWRVARVSSIISWDYTTSSRRKGDLSKKNPGSSQEIFGVNINLSDLGIEKEKFGDKVASSLEGAFNLSFLENPNSNSAKDSPVEVFIQYNAPVFRQYLKVEKEYLYWKCPGHPKEICEHQEDVFETGRDKCYGGH